uniref:S100P-binding protein n=1 Tax=Fundulus heteroclitus TaxID=8078 RepID=A0A3Q2P2L9_FUNHE
MAGKSDSTTVVSRLNPRKTKHLKPLSVFSQMVMCDQKGSPHPPKEPPTPFINLKIKIVNDGGRKRKLVEYDMDNDNSTPCKTRCASNALSPDLGFFTDSSGSPSGNYSQSPFAPPYPVLNEEIQALKSDIKETLSSRLDMEHVQCRCSKHEVKTVRNSPPLFDHDVDDVLCLNLQKQGAQESTDEEKPDAGVAEDDKGYVSSFYLQDNEECKTESPPAQQRHKRASPCGQHFSFLTKDDSKALSGPLLGPVKSDGDFLGGEDEVFNIGQPLFESSICQPAASVEQKSVTSEDPKEPLHVSQTYNSGDFTVDTLYESTLPLEVKVKSKVIVPNQPESKPASSIQPEERASSACLNMDQAAQAVRVHRPEIFDTSMEWERQKRQYILSVRSHMNENPGDDRGPMTELLDLMTHVAGQGRSNGCEWLHPSDLTCRNYQKRFGYQAPTMTLSEWQAHNQTHYRRFSNVPKMFKRSPFP